MVKKKAPAKSLKAKEEAMDKRGGPKTAAEKRLEKKVGDKDKR